MHARYPLSAAQRRGVVLVLILAMLGIMALIGVTFATLSGQSQVNARNFAQSLAQPDPEKVMDFGMSQLINDTNLPASALRGHSLKRDMFGNDSIASNVSAINNFALEIGCYLPQLPYLGVPALDYSSLFFLNVRTTTYNGLPALQYQTNIPIGTAANGATFGLNFLNWYLKLAPAPVQTIANGPTLIAPSQTFEVVADDDTGTDPFSSASGVATHLFILQSNSMVPNPQTTQFLDATTTLNSPFNVFPNFAFQNAAAVPGTSVPLTNPSVPSSYATPTVQSAGPFVLDGRRLRAFNGQGMTTVAGNGNFLFNGVGNGGPGNLGFPDTFGMDEDYDAPDLENWFLGLQSADGQVVIPSFHRPGQLIYQRDQTSGALLFDDWTNTTASAAASRSKILRRRQIDMGVGYPADPRPDPNTGRITYDIDNDGDGITDSVWLDLGYPIQKDPSGKLYKPLFAFMVLGLNGRLPLNTVGNLQGRHAHSSQYVQTPVTAPLPTPTVAGTPQQINWPQTQSATTYYVPLDSQFPYPLPFNFGDPTYYHTSHLGMSPSEINPAYAFMHVDTNPLAVPQYATPAYAGGNKPYYRSHGAEELQALLTGVRDPVTLTAIPGRWGEPEIIPSAAAISAFTGYPGVGLGMLVNPARAGRSYPQYLDARDSDYDSFDFYPSLNASAATPPWIPSLPEQTDMFDNSGAYLLPSERTRQFVTPQDSVGTGRVVHFDPPPLGGLLDYGKGGDRFGRVGFFMYFRPPGMPMVRPNGPPASSASAFYNMPVAPDTTTNLLHGYEAQRNPASRVPYPPASLPPARVFSQWMGSMPWNNNLGSTTVTAPFTIPGSFLEGVNSANPAVALPALAAMPAYPNSPYQPYLDATYISPTYPGFGGIYPPDQGPYFGPSPPAPQPYQPYQTPFNASSAGSLSMGEADQMDLFNPKPYDAPFGFQDLEWLYRKHDTDGASLSSRLGALIPTAFNQTDVTHSRLFSLESWENNSYVWSPDNPGNVFPQNHRFATGASASFDATVQGYTVAGVKYTSPVTAPSVLHKGRKINLNFPFPPQVLSTVVTQAALEPVRQKWITEVYYALKSIVPPKSIDTPEELAALSQFVINIVDFRDTDAVATQWTSPDVGIIPATTTSAPVYYFTATPPTAAAAPNPTLPLIQYGMEFPPVALNEVLAFEYKSLGGTGFTRRFFLELVNQLTIDAGATTATKLDLTNWHLSIAADDPTTRPDPVTGQCFALLNPLSPIFPAGYTPPKFIGDWTIASTDAVVLPSLVAAGTTGVTSYYYVLMDSGGAGTEVNAPMPANSMLPNPLLFPGGTGQTYTGPTTTTSAKLATSSTAIPSTNGYYWLYLSRPSDPNDPTSPLVVVDTFRFPYLMENGVFSPTGGGTMTTAPTQPITSLSRLQPYRGGHAVPKDSAAGTASNHYSPWTAYGFSEQASGPPATAATTWTYPPPTPATNYYAKYGAVASTGNIPNTLGAANSPFEPSDYLPFHDRDFSSVAELMLVPGCPPGLFTKQFVEQDPRSPITPLGPPLVPPPLTPPTTTQAPPVLPVGAAKPYPYLVDKFYYTADGQSFSDNTVPIPAVNTTTTPISGGIGPVVGFTTDAGWYKMLDFFEVPSSNIGATGPVFQGDNFDWLRQDRRPGQLNLNLIIDEEVFLGLIDDPRLNYNEVLPIAAPNAAQMLTLPQVVTQVDANGYPTFGADLLGPAVPFPNGRGFYSMPNRGAYNINSSTGFNYVTGTYGNGTSGSVVGNAVMKAAFSDFLKLRHGGSGWMYAYGSGSTGSGSVPLPFVGSYTPNVASIAPPVTLAATTVSPAIERPFRSLSFPDINFTVMRPAALPPPYPSVSPPAISVPSPYANTVPPFGDTNPTSNPSGIIGIPNPNTSNSATVNVGTSGGSTIGGFPLGLAPAYVYTNPNPPPPPTLTAKAVSMDPGLKNPYITDPSYGWYSNFIASLGTDFTSVPRDTTIIPQAPAIPMRRLFQIPDSEPLGAPQDNAAHLGDTNVNQVLINASPALLIPAINPPILPYPLLSNPGANLFDWDGIYNIYPLANATNGMSLVWGDQTTTPPPDNGWLPPAVGAATHLAGAVRFIPPVLSPFATYSQYVPNQFGLNTTSAGADRRQHPYFRNELMSKLINLSTVRTHQYAVWVTVGYFEVQRAGNSQLATVNPTQVPDILGAELNLDQGKNTRYRAFFIVDRTLATGFNPYNPGDYHDVITYRRRIE
jgi:large repetitive protein